MKYSVIMPSLLQDYGNSAKFKDQKFIRAVQSILDQTFKDFELIVISDGCELTKELVTNHFTGDILRLIEVKHKALFDNTPRNAGIDEAKGEYIIYCDTDDYWGSEHLEIIDRNIGKSNWVFYNDYVYKDQWIERVCSISIIGNCGTSNICHASRLGLRWDHPGYAHDYYFIQRLKNHKGFKRIETPEYFVCHIPNVYDL